MAANFDFNDLFIFDLANNHQGDVQHGLNIISGIGKVVAEAAIKGALKFQFRQIETFIHPDFKDKKDIKHIPRFISTALSKDDYNILVDEVRKQGMITMCTPFDEESVDIIQDLEIEVIKVASCSATDWPLLERISRTGKPVIISTAGLSMNNIDHLVSFLEHRSVSFALMHCVAVYPTPAQKLKLNQIALLKERFPDVPIGFSTHEDPNNFDAICIAYAKGARLFERHIGLNTDKYKLNAYSSTPAHIQQWIQAYKKAVEVCGGEERSPALPEEKESLHSLMRGVFASKKVKKGSVIKRSDVFFAMPLLDCQLASGNWRTGIIADKDYCRNEALSEFLSDFDIPKNQLIYQIMLQVKGMLNKARIFIGTNNSIEISHHYGLKRFREFGCVIIDCINRAYCKKLIIQLPRQKHPYHYHAKKEETFQLLHGDLEVELDGYRTKLKPGNTFLVPVNKWHKFHTLDGAIFEEVSTTHYNDDSIYEDKRIAKIPREQRKTSITNWESVVAESF